MINLIVSDIHGSKGSALKILDLDQKYNFDQIFFLGDINYNGARNVPPLDYSPLEVTEIFNKLKLKTVFISGNCDSRVDEFVYGKKFHEVLIFNKNNYKFYLTHGDLINKDNLKLNENEILIYGHTHIFELTKNNNGSFFINPGSISLPKNNNPKTYIIFDDEKMIFYLYNIKEELISLLQLNNQ